MKVVVILPTYNEVGNIRPLVAAVQQQFARLSHDLHILVVDDQSPDRTAEVVRELMQSYSNLHLLEGTKAGLGVAYIRGMTHAINVLSADTIFEMDADFSHAPIDIPRLLHEIDQGADFVIGSRYVPDGKIPESWGLYRKLLSWGGNLVARHIAGIPKVRDCTAGFRAIRTTLLRKIDLSQLRVQGYAFQVALLHAAVVKGAKVIEVPVEFVDRAHGNSKLGLADVVEFVANAWWIRLASYRTFIKFAVVGSSGVAVNVGAFTYLLNQGLNKFYASPLAIELSIVSNFFLNNYWTFRCRHNTDRVRIRGLKFNAVSLLSLAVSYGTFTVLTFVFPRVPPQIHQMVGIVPATFVNYFMNSYWTFKSDGNAAAASNFANRLVE